MIADNLQQLRDRISRRCAASGRRIDGIKLIAVSKFFGINAIKEANKLGIIDFGENKAQELRDKYSILGGSVTWHFIGTLQRNKVKYVVKAASLIHSVDSLELVDEIDKQAEKISKIQDILLEFKTSYETSKAGIQQEDQIVSIAEHCNNLSNIRLIGLMTMAPFTEDEKIIRKSFNDLRKLKDRINQHGHNLTELSMGMTSDFEIAVDEGATMLRIGSAIFGERDYSKDWRLL